MENEKEIEDLKNEIVELKEKIEELEKIVAQMADLGYDIYRLKN